jgi:pSer/pThr/pTyr-binding forkhead associated (FHA) protein
MAGQFYIWDAGSTNGVFVNNQQVGSPDSRGFVPRALKNNDLVRLGNISFTYYN